MRKVKLDVDQLAVESFAPEAARVGGRAGTVHAHNHTKGHDTCYFSCALGCTADESCYEVCATG